MKLGRVQGSAALRHRAIGSGAYSSVGFSRVEA